MIQRLFVHNYRCFANFELELANRSSVLVIGDDGAGKSTLGNALRLLQTIAQGKNRTRELLSSDDFSSHQPEGPLRIELSAIIDEERFEYGLKLTMPKNFREPKVEEEFLKIDQRVIFRRSEADMEVAIDSTSFLLDWHFVALPVVYIRGVPQRSMDKFRNWLARSIIISPVPARFSEESDSESFEPTPGVDNFAAWFSGILGEYPAAYNTIADYLKIMMPDFLDVQNRTTGETTKRIVARFEKNGRIFPTGLMRLSDGEKIFFLTALILAVNKHHGPVLCFWDEPDNYVSLSEVGRITTEIRKSFLSSGNGQILMASHNPEAIRSFTDESTVILTRRNHLEPTRVQWLSNCPFTGDLVNALIREDFSDGVE
ncbi:MAG: AAA family ATPase [Planctomycetaceae bacterium]|nr:AAA family ATPase [Planctomycetaceae bacterium]